MKPLEGIRIIELSTMITASFSTMMAAEQGAAVIKIEPCEGGDPMRTLGTQKGGQSGLFAGCNRGKRSVALDLKSAAGREVVTRLAADADVLVHNYRPGVMDKLGLGSAALRAANPRLIYVAISGFGTQGPLARAPAYDPIVQARAGFTSVQGGSGEPAFIRNLICDKITAYTAIQAFTAALFQRERTGSGQHIDLSMLDAGLFFMFPDGAMEHALLDDDAQQQPPLRDYLYDFLATRDGAITISAGAPQMRLRLYEALGVTGLAEDPRFATPAALGLHALEHRALMAEAAAGFDTADLMARLRANDVPAEVCQPMAATLTDPQLLANDGIREQQHPTMGRLRIVPAPPRFGGERLEPARPSPGHGEHSAEVLGELGFSAAEIEALRADGVLVVPLE